MKSEWSKASVLVVLLVFLVEPMSGSDLSDLEADLEEVHAFVSKVDPRNDIADNCVCYNATDHQEAEVLECRCFGKGFKEVPISLDESVHSIIITDSDIKIIERDSFQPYRFTLQDVTLGNLPHLNVIEGGTFRNILNLRTVYISHTPQLKYLNGVFDGVIPNKMLSLRIVHTGLMEIPDLSKLVTDSIMHMIDLDSNNIQKIGPNSIKVMADLVTLSHNDIKTIEAFAFNESHIATLILRGNRKLATIDQNAFNGLKSLQKLDLSETAIEQLPIQGIREIDILKVEKTPTMKVIPSVYEFQNLREAHLTHHFHCCAFKYPEQHDPKRHIQYQKMIEKICGLNVTVFDTGQIKWPKRNRRDIEEDEDIWGSIEEIGHTVNYDFEFGIPDAPSDWTPNLEHMKGHPRKTDHSHLDPLRGRTIEIQEAKEVVYPGEVLGTFHQSSAEIPKNNQIVVFCGNLTIRRSRIKCYPEPNALNPCEDIMGSYYLRVSVWFVVVLSVVGNLAVVVVVIFSGGELSVPRFLICNLAFADLCMGFYLLLIASMDFHSVGTYFNFAFDWQYGNGCQVAGFLTVFASQLSIFTLMIVTVERWFAIAYAIHLTRRIRLNVAAKIMVFGWLYSIIMASLPLMGVSNYSSTSICLPMEVNSILDQAYLIFMIALNSLAFILIVFCYAQIYFSLGRETRHSATKGEMTIAKKMALLVFTDFACWAPIAFFALTALAGYPLIGVTRSKILLVFFYPLNSCANPYLYAIMTSQYRKDFFILLSRFGLFRNKARRYTLSSMPTNNTHQLLTRSNGRKTSANGQEDAFV